MALKSCAWVSMTKASLIDQYEKMEKKIMVYNFCMGHVTIDDWWTLKTPDLTGPNKLDKRGYNLDLINKFVCSKKTNFLLQEYLVEKQDYLHE